MLGFATVDVVPEETYTVWLTSRSDGMRVNHTNAVVFRFDDPKPWERRLPEQMIADRVVLLTNPDLADLAGVSKPITVADVALLASATGELQALVTGAFEEHRSRPGKADLVEPAFRALPAPVDMQALAEAPPAARTLAVAQALSQAWSAWLGAEQERVRRSHYVPWDGPFEARQTLREFPPEFQERLHPQPLGKYR